MKSKIINLAVIVSVLSNFASAATFTTDHPAGRTGPGLDLDAYELFYSLYDQSIDLKSRELYVLGTDRTVPITFGAEKEGSSVKVLRVLSPSANLIVRALMSEPELGLLFIKGLLDGSILQTVVDKDGNAITLNVDGLRNLKAIDWSVFDSLKFDRNRRIWSDAHLYLDYMDKIPVLKSVFPGAPFSFLKPDVRNFLWEQKGTYRTSTEKNAGLFRDYDDWIPLYGESEKYIEKGHRELNNGWEVIFKPQKTYADFENQIIWFRQLMGSNAELFESPGHSRIVMPRIQLREKENNLFEAKAAELNRMLLAYLTLRGLKGKTGLLGGKQKEIPTEKQLADLNSGRGPIRLEKNRFYDKSIGIEFRTGMKEETVRRFTHAVYVSRLATNDMSDLASINDWTLLPKDIAWNPMVFKAADYGVQTETLQKALSNVQRVNKNDKATITDHLVPLWLWQNAPFLKGKKEELRRLTQQFLYSLAALEKPTYKDISSLVSDWVTTSNLIADIEAYMTPKRSFDRVTSPLTIEIKPGDVDVNKIDLGNEFTARMPLKLKGGFKGGDLAAVVYDMTAKEREARIKSVAETLKEKLTGSRKGVVRLNSGSHGHNLSIAYELTDNLQRTWRVEWDGVSRDYDADGNVLEATARGGHIEIVSPKYNPSLDEINAVYDMMEQESLVSDYKMGGSHINIDYEIFEKNPKALARFLTLFHQHRVIISFMFQHINRLRSAEPVEVSEYLDRNLRNFKGDQEALAQLLYNETYYNSRQNRKTRYTQIDVSNFMGSVIPEEFIKPDFDVVKARLTGGDGWERQFRVTKHKKMEFRLFDAAKDSLEAALQIKIVRALLYKALNDSSELILPVQKVDHEAYVKDPQRAYRDLQVLVTDLNLNYSDYSPYVTNKLVITQAYMNGKFYQNWFARAHKEFPKTDGWKKALRKARTTEAMVYSDQKVDLSKEQINSNALRCEGLF